ncbi:MAG: hypothetical protein J7M38_02515 [Armatimonadetes bacterium]|nr:hypothetical protein [Armatimonadota bacterium]
MKETTGDLWQFHDSGYPIVIPTNLVLDSRRRNVMGKGLAKQAKQRYPDLPVKQGKQILKTGRAAVVYYPEYNLFCFPTKYKWWDRSNLELIQKMAAELADQVDALHFNEVYLPRLGCGLGGLWWSEVSPLLQCFLDDRFIVVDWVTGRQQR